GVAMDAVVLTSAVPGVDTLVEGAIDVVQPLARLARQPRDLRRVRQQQIGEVVPVSDLDPHAQSRGPLTVRAGTGGSGMAGPVTVARQQPRGHRPMHRSVEAVRAAFANGQNPGSMCPGSIG